MKKLTKVRKIFSDNAWQFSRQSRPKKKIVFWFFFLISDLMGYILKRLITGLYNCVSVNGLEYCEPMYVKA